jgi:hypothetical protein
MRSSDLRNLALVCKHIAPIAQEILHNKLILYEQEAIAFLEHLFVNPVARSRVKSLTIELKVDPTLKDDLYRAPRDLLPALQPNLLQQCMLAIENFPIEAQTKEWWIFDLSKGQIQCMAVLCLIIAMLHNLKHLYLGASRLVSFPFFRDVYDDQIEMNWNIPNLHRLANLMSGKLTRLELSNFEFCDCPCVPHPDTCPVGEYFPDLQWLSVSTSTIWVTAHILRLIPEDLKEVVFWANGFTPGSFEQALIKISRHKETSFPSLQKMSVYWVEDSEESDGFDSDEEEIHYTEEAFSAPLCAVGVEYFQFLPGHYDDERGLKPWYFMWGPRNHPWSYTKEELMALEAGDMDHTDEETELPAEPSTYVSTLAQFFLHDV